MGGENGTHVRDDEVEGPLPTAAILCLAMSGYIAFVLIGLLIRKCFIAHGFCDNCCPKSYSSECCNFCRNCGKKCDCKFPTVDSCLDAICPTKQRINCIEFMVCDWNNLQCCQEGAAFTCGSGDCSCTCETPQCSSINCLCCEISFRNVSANQ